MRDAYKLLEEREKELMCIYSVEEILEDKSEDLNVVLFKILDILPKGWQYSTICEAKIIYKGKEYIRDSFEQTKWFQSSELIIDNNIVGKIEVYYTDFVKYNYNESQFLPEEQKLLNTIAGRISNFIFRQKLENTISLLKTPDLNENNEVKETSIIEANSDEHWKWRYKMVEKIADKLDLKEFGLKAMYLIGSTKNCNAGPASDIDLLFHFKGDENQKRRLKSWIEGWSYGLAEINYLKTGYVHSNGIIDNHIITDEDIEKKDSFASMIGALSNSARLIKS